MSNGAIAGGAAGGAAAAAAIANAVKASGAIVKLEPMEFIKILNRADKPLVVYAYARVFFSSRHKYLTSYKGLFFYTSSASPLSIPGRIEMVVAKNIWIPG
jgi:hypothetical protein